MSSKPTIGKLIFLYIRKELNPAGRTRLDAWRHLSSENEQTFQDAIAPEKIWADLKAIHESEDRVYEKIRARNPGFKEVRRSKLRRIGVVVLKIAATILILFCISTAVVIYKFRNVGSDLTRPDAADHLAAVISLPDLTGDVDYNRGFMAGYAGLHVREEKNDWFIAGVPDKAGRKKDVYFRQFTSKGNRLLMNFSDGTSIWFNSGSTIKYPAWMLSDSIHIYLTGEVYVHTAPGTKHIYLIKISPPADSTEPSAFKKAIEDKTSRSIQLVSRGGDFHLEAFAGGPATTAILVSGDLRIDSVGGNAVSPFVLQPGQQAVLDSGSLHTSPPEHINDIWTWKNR